MSKLNPKLNPKASTLSLPWRGRTVPPLMHASSSFLVAARRCGCARLPAAEVRLGKVLDCPCARQGRLDLAWICVSLWHGVRCMWVCAQARHALGQRQPQCTQDAGIDGSGSWADRAHARIWRPDFAHASTYACTFAHACLHAQGSGSRVKGACACACAQAHDARTHAGTRARSSPAPRCLCSPGSVWCMTHPSPARVPGERQAGQHERGSSSQGVAEQGRRQCPKP